MRDFLTLLRTPVRAIFSFVPKLTMQLLPCCNAFWGNFYPFTMPEPPGELMKKKFVFLRIRSGVTHLRACDKTIFRIGITKEINKQENANSQQNFVVLLAGRDSEHKIT